MPSKNTRPPIHPGAILREDVIPALGVTISGMARNLGISRQTLHRVLREEGAITPDLALRIGKFVGNGPEIWLRMQANFDLWRRGLEIAPTIHRIKTAEMPSVG